MMLPQTGDKLYHMRRHVWQNNKLYT